MFGTCTANEGRVVDQTILEMHETRTTISVAGRRITHLGCVALGFESAEKSLLCAEDLYRAGWVLAKVGQGSRVADETSAYTLAKQSGKTRGDKIHFLGQVGSEGLAVVGNRDNACGKSRNVKHVDVGKS